ncbi:MAG: hypothetical protein LBB98_07560, partial [Treponema sp.]|nr:hypothetical protein [Treponema sp.]
MIRIKITMSFLGLLLAGGILLSSCSQDDIFYTIQYDKVLNKDAAIPGSPGRIIELGDALYTGSNAVYEYKKPEIDGEAASWQQLPAQPGGKRILDLTGTGTYLYALVMQGVHLSDSGLYRKNPKEDGEWKWVANLTGYPIQSLWGAGDVLFAGARAGNGNYVLLYVNDLIEGTPILSQVSDVSGMLKAAAKVGNSYYVAIEGKGLVDLANPAVVLDVATDIVGLI